MHSLSAGHKAKLRKQLIVGARNYNKYLANKIFKIICDDGLLDKLDDINSLCVLILPISLSPYSVGYEVLLLLCLKRTSPSACIPSNFCLPFAKCMCKFCFGH